jgi:hypothetical protein
MKITDNPMEGLCGAKNRSGNPCKKHPIKGRTRCANHGGKTLVGKQHGRYRTGLYTKEMKEYQRKLRAEARKIVQHFRDI